MKRSPLTSILSGSTLIALATYAWIAGAPDSMSHTIAAPSDKPTIKYIRLRGSTPSPAWSPTGRYLAFHDLHFPSSKPKTTPKAKATLKEKKKAEGKKTLSLLRTKPPKNRNPLNILRPQSKTPPNRRRQNKRPETTFVEGSSPYDRVVIYDTHSKNTKQYPFLSTKKVKKPIRLRRGTPSLPTLSRVGLFHPQWGSDQLLATSSCFSGQGILGIRPKGVQRSFQPWSTVSFHPNGQVLIGRKHQTGVFLAHIDNPKQSYAVVDERRTIRGLFPRFSPNGRYLAWIDAGTTYRASPLRVYHFPYRAEQLKQAATLWVPSPWKYKNIRHKALSVSKVSIPKTKLVVEFAWGPKSNQLAYVQGTRYRGYGDYQYTSEGLYRLKLDGSKPTLLDIHGENPSFAPNGTLYYNRSKGGIYRWDSKTNKAVQVLSFGYEPRISPTGKQLAFLRWTPQPSSSSKLFLGILPLSSTTF